MKVALGCDHGGFVLKAKVVETLQKLGAEVVDFGTNNEESVDYPVYAEKVAHAVADKVCELGVLLCGTGIGMSIAANKVKGIRCANVATMKAARLCKEHNNANMIALAADEITIEAAKEIVYIWLNSEFLGGRHQTRVDMITEYENKK